jgi:hypothetical protein
MAAGDWIKAGVHGFIQAKDFTYDRELSALIEIELYNEKGELYRERRSRITPFIGNEEYSIWSAGESSIWSEASFYLQLPSKTNGQWYMLVKIYNPHGRLINLDDFYVEHYVD